MKVSSMIKRIKSRISELENMTKAASIYESFDGNFPENYNGLVILHPDPSPPKPQKI